MNGVEGGSGSIGIRRLNRQGEKRVFSIDILVNLINLWFFRSRHKAAAVAMHRARGDNSPREFSYETLAFGGTKVRVKPQLSFQCNHLCARGRHLGCTTHRIPDFSPPRTTSQNMAKVRSSSHSALLFAFCQDLLIVKKQNDFHTKQTQ
jgi:hypothetical protein